MNIDKAEFWEQKYQADEAGWNIKSATPAFLDILENPILAECKKILVLGCGFGYDAVAAAKKGFEVTAIDISSTAILQAKKIADEENVKINFILDDLFLFDENVKYDIIYDYVMYCAINPDKRKEYSEKVSSLLNTNGLFLSIFFPVENKIGGPPFGVDMNEVENLFGKNMELFLSTTEIRSIKPRAGREHLQIYRKK